jgi:hypothetical protein
MFVKVSFAFVLFYFDGEIGSFAAVANCRGKSCMVETRNIPWSKLETGRNWDRKSKEDLFW